MSARGESVLVVEDDEGLAQVIAMALRSEGFETQTARDGLDGCTSYFRHPTDWVVTDIQMPQLDGITMMECIRTFQPQVKTVYMSGAVDEYQTLLEREIEEHAAAVLPKPFSCRNLIKQLTTTANSSSRRALKNNPRA
jgi:CheY-like chemotaxis protein